MRRVVLIAVVMGSLWLQGNDLVQQFRVIKALMPGATKCGMLINGKTLTEDVKANIQEIGVSTGVQVVQAPVNSIKEVSQALKALAPYNIDFLYLLEDKMITGANVVKFTCRSAVKDGKPVFAASTDCLEMGLCGELINEGGTWKMKLNGKIMEQVGVPQPGDMSLFIVP
jgi:ABC-type uncharacterized transport system substrate-binding protein